MDKGTAGRQSEACLRTRGSLGNGKGEGKETKGRGAVQRRREHRAKHGWCAVDGAVQELKRGKAICCRHIQRAEEHQHRSHGGVEGE
jgi:hypothetical protein